jgi:8-oxo-dGTP diphosphatase
MKWGRFYFQSEGIINIKVACGSFPVARLNVLEEVGVRILSAQPLLKISHDYGDKHVMLDVWLSRQSSAISDARVFEGEAQGKENQQIIWADIASLDNYHFPEANKAIITRLKTLS